MRYRLSGEVSPLYAHETTSNMRARVSARTCSTTVNAKVHTDMHARQRVVGCPKIIQDRESEIWYIERTQLAPLQIMGRKKKKKNRN